MTHTACDQRNEPSNRIYETTDSVEYLFFSTDKL